MTSLLLPTSLRALGTLRWFQRVAAMGFFFSRMGGGGEDNPPPAHPVG